MKRFKNEFQQKKKKKKPIKPISIYLIQDATTLGNRNLFLGMKWSYIIKV